MALTKTEAGYSQVFSGLNCSESLCHWARVAVREMVTLSSPGLLIFAVPVMVRSLFVFEIGARPPPASTALVLFFASRAYSDWAAHKLVEQEGVEPSRPKISKKCGDTRLSAGHSGRLTPPGRVIVHAAAPKSFSPNPSPRARKIACFMLFSFHPKKKARPR